MEPNLVILAGGISSRMRKTPVRPEGIDPCLIREADLKPKSMIGVGKGGRPFLDHLLMNAAEAGYQDVVLVVGQSDVAMRAYYTVATVEGLGGGCEAARTGEDPGSRSAIATISTAAKRSGSS